MSDDFNERYGHANVLRRYCGIGDQPIRGRYQHGWSAGSGWDTTGNFSGPYWAWGDRGVTVAESVGLKAIAIGSPWLYLPSKPEAYRKPRGVIALPMHWSRDDAPYVKWLRERYLRPGIRLQPDNVYWPMFLDDLRETLREYEAATSNIVATAIFYAAYEGLNTLVEGPLGDHTSVPDSSDRLIRNPAWVNREFPDGITREAADRELGLKYKRSPSELRKLLWA